MMQGSRGSLARIWESSPSYPPDVPNLPNGIWSPASSPWSSVSTSPNTFGARFNSIRTLQHLENSIASLGISDTSHVSSANSVAMVDNNRYRPTSAADTRWSSFESELQTWEKRLSQIRPGRQGMTQTQLNAFIEFLRRLRMTVRRKREEGLDLCAFCRNNGEPFEVYITHKVRDPSGRVICPVLRLLSCPLCKSTGDNAHTIKYCPYRRQECLL
ncbi:unnamed protein product [Dicrocoelium dendriticum]|nr:unnamed protein product [Dicrocoelium dendriticum]